jgi:hypothetical protein
VATAASLKFLSLKIMCTHVRQNFWKTSSNSEHFNYFLCKTCCPISRPFRFVMVAILNPKWLPKYRNPPIWAKFALLLHLPTDLPTIQILVAQEKIVGISNWNTDILHEIFKISVASGLLSENIPGSMSNVCGLGLLDPWSCIFCIFLFFYFCISDCSFFHFISISKHKLKLTDKI